MFKNVYQGKEARDAVKVGMDIVANAVRVSMGEKGRNVILGNGYGAAVITKDGVSIAKSIVLADVAANIGANLLKEAAIRTVQLAGDGTSAATVLCHAIIEKGLKAIDEGANPVLLKKGIEKGVELVVAKLKELSKEIDTHEKLIQIATISANNDAEIGKLIADAYEEVGRDGQIDVSDSKSHKTYVEIVNGVKFDRGYLSPIFANNPKRSTCEMENPIILVSDRKLSTIKEAKGFLEKILSKPETQKRPILMIVDRLEGEAASFLYHNSAQRTLNICVVHAPEYNDDRTRALEDIAILVGAKFISDGQGMSIEKATFSDCGTAEKIVVTADSTLIINGEGNGDDVATRTEQIKQQLAEAETEHQTNKLKSRLTRFIGKIATLRVGDITQTAATEKKDRVDDALCATRAANEEGYLVGGGAALLTCVGAIDPIGEGDIHKGLMIVRNAMDVPFKQILTNAGVAESEILNTGVNILNGGYGTGYNVRTEKIEDLFEAGVIDPTKVVRCSLENAGSVAGTFITTECVVADVKPKEY